MMTLSETAGAAPRYERIKDYIQERIRQRDWAPHERLPSEAELVARFRVSRMTVNRALRELAQDGIIERQQGLGSFVAAPKEAALVELRDIASELRELGMQHSAAVVTQRESTASADIAGRFDLRPGAAVFLSEIVHYADGAAFQFEERYVNPATAPDYLEQDFTRQTPNAYLTLRDPATEMEQSVQASLPDPRVQQLLGLTAGEPCLTVRRRTWASRRVATIARLVYAGREMQLRSRYRLGGTGITLRASGNQVG